MSEDIVSIDIENLLKNDPYVQLSEHATYFLFEKITTLNKHQETMQEEINDLKKVIKSLLSSPNTIKFNTDSMRKMLSTKKPISKDISQTIKCECGINVTKKSMRNHIQTYKHKYNLICRKTNIS